MFGFEFENAIGSNYGERCLLNRNLESLHCWRFTELKMLAILYFCNNEMIFIGDDVIG